jgi:hypothetical protein
MNLPSGLPPMPFPPPVPPLSGPPPHPIPHQPPGPIGNFNLPGASNSQGLDPYAWGKTFNWWEYATEAKTDPRVARIGYQLASYLIRDRLGDSMDGLKGLRIKIFDFSTEYTISALFEALGLKVETIKSSEAPFLLSSPFRLNQLIVLYGLTVLMPKDLYVNLIEFVTRGGRLFCIQCSAASVTPFVGTRIVDVPHSTVVCARMRVANDKQFFSAFPEGSEIDLDLTRLPISVPDERVVQVLVKVAARTYEPVLVRLTQGDGLVYFYSSRLFLSKKQIESLLPKWKDPPKPTRQEGEKRKKIKKERLKDREKDFDPCAKWLQDKGASPETIMAWQCCSKVGQDEGFMIALRSFPSLEALTKILLHELPTILALEPEEKQ